MVYRLRIMFWRRASDLAGWLIERMEVVEGWCAARLKRALRR
jgi:hypothetical protein